MKFFTTNEFVCPCCKEHAMQDVQMRMLDEARALAGVPFKLNSAYRCPEHNAKVGGVSTSAHVKGYACDIAVKSSTDRFKILQALIAVGFTRIGVYKTFIHCDTDPDLPQGVIWFGK